MKGDMGISDHTQLISEARVREIVNEILKSELILFEI